MKERLKLIAKPELQNASLIIGWDVDAGKLGSRVTGYLLKKLNAQPFCEIEPDEFFHLGGVNIEENIVQFPESTFYACPQNNLVIFKATPPSYEWSNFFTLILDAAESYCHVKEIYAIGGMISLGAHTMPRLINGNFNSTGLKEALSEYDLARGTDYETPPGQRPTLNSFLLWSAGRRNIPGVALWLPVPFYLLAVGDPKAEKKILEFINSRFNLDFDFADLNEEIARQSQRLAELRNSFPHIHEAISKLERNTGLTEEESQRLIKDVGNLLKEKERRSRNN